MALKLAEAYVQITGRTKSFNQALTRVQARLQGATAQMEKMASGAKTIFIAIGAAIAGATYATVRYEKEMAMVSTMLSGPAVKWMSVYSEGVSKLAVEFGESTETLSKGLYDILSASIDASKAMEVLTISGEAAQAGMVSTAESVDVITTGLNAYGLSADKAGEVSDKLFAAVKAGKLTFSDLAKHLGRIATTASQCGVSLDELLASISTLTRRGMRTELAVTYLNQALMAFTGAADSAKAMASRFGFEMTATTLQSQGLVGILGKLKDANQEELSVLFTSATAIAAVNGLLADMEGLNANVASSMTSAGERTAAYNKMAQTTGYRLNQMKQGLLAAARAFGDVLSPAVITAAGVLKNVSEAMTQLSQPTIRLISNVALATLGTAALIIVLHKLLAALTLLVAHPAVAAFIVFAGAAVYLYTKITDVSDAALGLHQNLETLVSSTKQLQVANLELSKRLTELLDKQTRTNEEQEEANRIAAKLEKTYGNLGITYNEAGDAVGRAADSMDRLTASMKKQMVLTLEKKLADQRENLEKMSDTLDQFRGYRPLTDITDLPSNFIGNLRYAGREIGLFGGAHDALSKKVKASNQALKETEEALADLKETAEYDPREPTIAAPPPPPTGLSSAEIAAKTDVEAWEEAQKEIARSRRNHWDQEREDVRKRAKEMLDIADKLGKDKAEIWRWETDELRKINKAAEDEIIDYAKRKGDERKRLEEEKTRVAESRAQQLQRMENETFRLRHGDRKADLRELEQWKKRELEKWADDEDMKLAIQERYSAKRAEIEERYANKTSSGWKDLTQVWRDVQEAIFREKAGPKLAPAIGAAKPFAPRGVPPAGPPGTTKAESRRHELATATSDKQQVELLRSIDGTLDEIAEQGPATATFGT